MTQSAGSGKSAIYQIAGTLIPGSTVVISPLIALQRDQVESIAQQDVGEAAVVNSTVPTDERQEVFEALDKEKYQAALFILLGGRASYALRGR